MKTRSILFTIFMVLTLSLHAWAFDVSCTWDQAPSEQNITEYRLYFQVEGNPTVELIVLPGSVNSHIIRDISQDKWYFWLTAINANGESLPTPKIIKDYRIPATPTGFEIVR